MRRARDLGCRWVEFDVRLTRDGEPVLLHDSRLDRTTDGAGRVAALPVAAVLRHDAGRWFAPEFAGERVPRLGEALALLGELGLGANIEIKAGRGRGGDAAAAVAAMLARAWPAGLPPPLLSSFDRKALLAAGACAPGIARGVLFRAVPRTWRRTAERLGAASLHADHRRLTPRLVADIRTAGCPLLAYTVNEPARALELFEWGVGSVFSDVPHRILAAIAQDGPRQPAAAGLNLR